MKPKTPKDIILPAILPPEDQHKIVVSRYYSVNPESQHLGLPLSPYYHECNIRIDWGTDGGIYRVVWANVEKKPQHPVKSYTNNSPQYATDDRYTKPQNVYTSEERVHEIDKSIHDLRAAAEMALKAMERRNAVNDEYKVYLQDAIETLRQALAQPDQEPVAAVELVEIGSEQVIAVAWYDSNAFKVGTKLYTALPSKHWVSLTDEEIMEPWPFETRIELVRWIEAKLREKNK